MNIDGLYNKIEIVKNEFTMLMPEGLSPMSDALAQLKYPAHNRPQIILTDITCTVDYKFSYIQAEVDISVLGELIKQTKISLKKIFTGIEYYEEDIINLNDTKLGWYDYKSPAIGGNTYNISFYTWIKGRLLQGTFTCDFENADKWRESFLYSIMSIEEKRL